MLNFAASKPIQALKVAKWRQGKGETEDKKRLDKLELKKKQNWSHERVQASKSGKFQQKKWSNYKVLGPTRTGKETKLKLKRGQNWSWEMGQTGAEKRPKLEPKQELRNWPNLSKKELCCI